MSTADKLNKLLETKEAIKQAIIDKGGTVGDVFADYPTAIQNIQSGGSGPFVVPAGMKFAYSDIEEFPEDWDWSEMGQAANHSSRFQGCTRLRSAPKLSTVNATSTSDMFKDCVLLRYIDWDGFDTSSNKNFGSMFSGCSSLQSIPELDCSSNTSTYSSYGSPMSGCYALKDFGGLKGINKSIYFDRDYCLSYESLLNIINGLASGVSGQTLTLNEDLVNQLSDDDIAIATNKGWSVSPARTITSPVVVTSLNQISSEATQITPKTYDLSQFTGKWGASYLTNLPNRLKIYSFSGDLSGTTDATGMLSSCNFLHHVHLTGTESIEKMDSMFAHCGKLLSVTMTGDVSKVTDVTRMFQNTTTEGTFYYNPAYDYSKIIAELPSTWTAVPLTE